MIKDFLKDPRTGLMLGGFISVFGLIMLLWYAIIQYNVNKDPDFLLIFLACLFIVPVSYVIAKLINWYRYDKNS